MIDVSGLSKSFRHVHAVSDLSFEALPGRVTGFLGPNGSGKTTTLRILLGLVAPTTGKATIGGIRYRDLPEPAKVVGAVLEANSFHPARRAATHLSLLATAAGIGKGRIAECLEIVGLTSVARRKVGGFSLGMRQRLELAGALLGDPPVLVLDEPSNGLDPEGIHWLRGFVRGQAARGRTVLISSHLLGEIAQMADDVVIISQGRLRAAGPVTTVLAGTTPAATVLRTPEPDRAATILKDAGHAVTTDGDPRTLHVDGVGTETLGPLLAAHSIVLHELREITPDLESVFLELTRPEAP